MIRDDVTEVVDALIDQRWWIVDVDGWPTTAGPEIMPHTQIPWLLIAYHMTGEERFKAELEKRLLESYRWKFDISLANFFSRYAQYYGNNLRHINFYGLLRLARVYVNEDDYLYFQDRFDKKQHTFTRLSHNAFFTEVHMSQGIYDPNAGEDPYLAQVVEDLTDFMPAPKYQYATTPPAAPLDPISVFLADLWDRIPLFEDLMGDIDEQALDAYRVPYQCTKDFQWQRNPFEIECGFAEEPRKVNPGVDYLAAYWMAAFHGFVTKDQ